MDGNHPYSVGRLFYNRTKAENYYEKKWSEVKVSHRYNPYAEFYEVGESLTVSNIHELHIPVGYITKVEEVYNVQEITLDTSDMNIEDGELAMSTVDGNFRVGDGATLLKEEVIIVE